MAIGSERFEEKMIYAYCLIAHFCEVSTDSSVVVLLSNNTTNINGNGKQMGKKSYM